MYRSKTNPVVLWMKKIECVCEHKQPIHDDKITYIECKLNPGKFCKYQNCPLKDKGRERI